MHHGADHVCVCATICTIDNARAHSRSGSDGVRAALVRMSDASVSSIKMHVRSRLTVNNDCLTDLRAHAVNSKHGGGGWSSTGEVSRGWACLT